ncbi:MAG: Hsp70 family protein [Treponema sp.]|nr:Hsp70 family protein [Treponema sp.]
MKTIGIKLADGTFYPILEEGEPKTRKLDLTTVKDNQTKVQVDLYRSETGTMEDAEYVDTLEVTQLNPRPNGEPSLHLSVSLDENNELKAEVIDAETGSKSETQVKLVSRTLAERENTDVDFSIADTGIADSELAALEAQNQSEDVTEKFTTEDFSFDDLTDDEFASTTAKKVEEETEQVEKEINATEESAALAATASFDDISLDLPSFDEIDSSAAKTLPADDEPTVATDEFALDSEETKADDLFDVPDFSFDTVETDSSEPVESATEAETTAETETVSEAEVATGPSLEDFSLDLPDFDDTEFDTTATKSVSADPLADFTVPDADSTADFDTTVSDDSTADFDTTVASDSAADFDTTISSDFDTDSAAETQSDLNEADFSLPDFDDTPAESTDLNGLFDDPIFENDDFSTKSVTENSSSMTATSSAMDFSDLYDEETIAGEHSTPYEDEGDVVKKKTRVPVIICVVCAIICIIATLLVLFVIPSKYNLIKSRNTKKSSGNEESGWIKPMAEITLEENELWGNQKPAKPEPAPNPAPIEEPEPKVPSVVVTDAQEDKIVVAPTPDIVPVPAPKPKEKRDVRYRIKWGDTLWDISESYYKNPWKYHKIARYNKIKNPDLIISGTDILIPED